MQRSLASRSMAQVVLHGTRCLQHHGRATALMVQTGAIQTTIFVSCLGATWEQNVPPKFRPWCLRAQLTWYYSHDTCFSTPNCREDHLDRNCPYDNRVSGWATSADCKHGWSDVCDCLYQGSNLPELLYENLMDNLSSIALYGTSCAAWDHIPGTPLAHHCLPGSDWSGDKNWCQVPWCYVNSSCPSRMQSRLFGNAFYSYDTCGNAPNCYDDWTHRSCPFDPYGSKSYTLHQHGGCECIFHGRHLPEEVFSNFAQAEPGRFQNLSHVRLYGTTCAAWDQMPQSPWASDCPFGADWCSSAYNWCQLPLPGFS